MQRKYIWHNPNKGMLLNTHLLLLSIITNQKASNNEKLLLRKQYIFQD